MVLYYVLYQLVEGVIVTKKKTKKKTHACPQKKCLSPEENDIFDDRIDIKIPKIAKIYPFFDGDKTIIKMPLWKQLDAIYERAQKYDEGVIRYLFDSLLGTLSVTDSKKAKIIESMRPIIFNQKIRIEEALFKAFRTFSISDSTKNNNIQVDLIIGIFWGIFERVRNGELDPKKVEESMLQILKSNKDKELTEDDL